jgi:predicted CXXCH cytochrome family protein
MKRTIIVLALAVAMLLSLGGLALAQTDLWPDNPSLPLGFPHMNSNNTGFFAPVQRGTLESLVRAVYGQLVHTNFQLNTNSCASCHMTHTAVGDNLLFQRTVTDTCFACHDGTIGELNVLAAPRAGTTGIARFGGSETAGTFGADPAFAASVHNVENVITVSGAPGGNRFSDVDSAGLVSTGWRGTFSCSSCHAPHGSYSIRLLHPNPNFLGWRDQNHRVATNFATGGLWNRGNTLTVSGTVYPDHAVHGAVYRATVTAAVYAGVYNDIALPWLYGYLRGTTLTTARTVYGVAFPVGRYNQFNTRIYSTALYDPNTVADGGGPFSTLVDAVYLLNRFFEINYRTGEIVITTANRAALAAAVGADILGTLRMDIGRALVVTADANAGRPVLALDHLNTRTYSQRTFNMFCAACHTDYLPQAGVASTRAAALPGGYGTYSLAHRHTINRAATRYGTMTVTGLHAGAPNQLLCVSCHFAHGADSRMMRLANASLNDFVAPSVDVNPSSALKRYVNQAVCWSCHTNSAATVFRNTNYFWDGYDTNRGYQW